MAALSLEDLDDIGEVIEAALARPAPARRAFLADQCGADTARLDKALRVLDAVERADGFLDRPAAELVPALVADFVGAERDPPEPGSSPERVGAYRVLREIGRGGMADVYLAERADDEYRKQVALKIVRPDPTGHLGLRFRHERQVLATLDHPHIARLHDGGTTPDGRPYLVMEYVTGEPIDRYANARALSVRQRLALFDQVCDAVVYAHRRFVVHRDLKPANILVTPDGEVKLLDFGVAKLLEPEAEPAETPVTRAGMRVMTPEYASPEQFRGESITTATDVYALGLLLFELLTGERPHAHARRPADIERAVLQTDPNLPSEVARRRAARSEVTLVPAGELQGELDRIVGRALEREPGARYPSVEALRADLTPYLGRGSLVSKRVASKRALALAGAAAAIAAIGFVLWRGSPDPAATHALVFASDASHRDPSLSPDGSLVAFISSASGTPQVWIKNMFQGDPVQITFGDVEAASPKWSPHGDRILFDRLGQGIWSVGPLGTPRPRRLIEDGRHATMSADGTRLVFERARAIWTADADGQHQRRIDDVPVQWTSSVASSPALSPDGNTVAFFHAENGPNGDFWIAPATGGPPRRLTFDVCAGGEPAWTPDGRALIVWSVRGGSTNLWRVPIDGSSPSALTSGAGEDRSPAVSVDGRTVVYTNVRNEWALRVLDPVTGDDRELVARRSGIWLPEFSPSGDRIAFFHQVGRDFHLFTVREDGSDLRQITHADGEWNIHPSWSPDGRFLYYYNERPDPVAFRRIGADGGTPEDVVPGWRWRREMHARVDATGERVVYTLQGSGVEEVTIVRHLKTGHETTLPLPHLHNPQWTAGGDIVGYRHDGTIVSCALSEDRCDVITQGLRPTFTPEGGRVFFQRPGSETQRVELWAAGADGRDATKIRDVGVLAPLSYSFSVSPRQRIAWTEFRAGRHELWRLALDDR